MKFSFEQAVEITYEAMKRWVGPPEAETFISGFIIGCMRRAYDEQAFKTEVVEVLRDGIELQGKGPPGGPYNAPLRALRYPFNKDLVFTVGLRERPLRFDRKEVL